MRFRVTKEEDLPAVMTILHQAQAYFKAHGIDQWQDGYPDEATLRRDIQNGTAYVAELDGAVAACATIAFAAGRKLHDDGQRPMADREAVCRNPPDCG